MLISEKEFNDNYFRVCGILNNDNHNIKSLYKELEKYALSVMDNIKKGYEKGDKITIGTYQITPAQDIKMATIAPMHSLSQSGITFNIGLFMAKYREEHPDEIGKTYEQMNEEQQAVCDRIGEVILHNPAIAAQADYISPPPDTLYQSSFDNYSKTFNIGNMTSKWEDKE